ncbi:MAG: hypothetical protein M3R65_10270 [Gemmatimonadota bacterium]|nr:hypothetical protein [Gemmatimonadota bacterium]
MVLCVDNTFPRDNASPALSIAQREIANEERLNFGDHCAVGRLRCSCDAPHSGLYDVNHNALQAVYTGEGGATIEVPEKANGVSDEPFEVELRTVGEFYH